MRTEAREAAVLEGIIPQLEAEGFEVYTRPSPLLLPPFMGNYSPDAIALRPDRKLAIEVVREGPSSKGRLDKIRGLLSGHKDWELRVYWVSPTGGPKLIEPAPRGAIEQAIEAVDELVAAGRTAPALLMAWAALEALGRALLPDAFARPQTPARLIEVLAGDGQITPAEADRLRQLADSRNQLIHGGFGISVPDSDLKEFVLILKALLQSLR